MRWQSILSGVLGLALLEVVVSNQAAAGRVGGMLQAISGVISRVLSPTVAAIPDLRKHGGAAPTSSGGGSTVQPAVATTPSSPDVPPSWTTSPTNIVNV